MELFLGDYNECEQSGCFWNDVEVAYESDIGRDLPTAVLIANSPRNVCVCVEIGSVHIDIVSPYGDSAVAARSDGNEGILVGGSLSIEYREILI